MWINAQHASRGGRCPMANVIKKHSISSALAQKMVDAAVAKARELGVCENVAILEDGGNLKAFSRMDGAPILSIEIAQNKAYTALFGVIVHALVAQGKPWHGKDRWGLRERCLTKRQVKRFPIINSRACA